MLVEEDGSKIFLVDFQKKVIDNFREDRNRKKDKQRAHEEDNTPDSDIPPPQNEGEEWYNLFLNV